MKLLDKVKNSNVISLDIWVFVAVIALFNGYIPASEKTNSIYIVPMVVSIMLYIGLFIFILVFCSRLRQYRYLDIYIECKKYKKASSLLVIMGIISIVFVVLLDGIPIYEILYSILSVILSVHLNNSKDFRLTEVK